MATAILGLLAETPLHSGVGSDGGVVDLPVAREVVTGYPVIFGSSMKGCLRYKGEQTWKEKQALTDTLFGSVEQAGSLAVHDARLLLLPVRSLSGHYRWLTCPYVLERLQRDMDMIGLKKVLPELAVKKGEVWAEKGERLFLEELSFSVVVKAEAIRQVADMIKPLLHHTSVQQRVEKQLVICHDEEFSYYTKCALQIQAHNRLDSETKITIDGGLWYVEYLPSDTMLYTVLQARPSREEAFQSLKELVEKEPYLQVGGNETTGCGWCALSWQEGGRRI